MKVLVLGGTVWLGHETARCLVDEGHDVTCAARGTTVPTGANLVQIDRADDDALTDLANQRWDAVVDVARQPGHVRRAARDLASVADRYVFVSTGNVYRTHDEIGADEDAPLQDPLTVDAFTDPEDYGPAKVACEKALRTTFSADRLLIARSGLIGGPGDHTERTTYWPWRFAHPAVADKVLVPDAPQLPVAVIDVRDLAAWLVHCITHGISGTYNATGTPVPLVEHLSTAGRAAHSTAQAIPAPEQWLHEHQVADWGGPRSMPLWLSDRSWRGFNARSNVRALGAGLTLRPLVDSLRDGLLWREAKPTRQPLSGLIDEDERALLRQLEPNDTDQT